MRLRSSAWIRSSAASLPTLAPAPGGARPLRFPRLAKLLDLYLIRTAPAPAWASSVNAGAAAPDRHTLLAAAGDLVARVTSLALDGFAAEETCTAVLELPGACPLLERLLLRAHGDVFLGRPAADAAGTGSFLAELAAGLTRLGALAELRLEVQGGPSGPAAGIATQQLLVQLAALSGLTHLRLGPMGPSGIPPSCFSSLPALPLLVDLTLHVSVDDAAGAAGPAPGSAAALSRLPLPPTLKRLRLDAAPPAPGQPGRGAPTLHAADVQGLLRCPQLEGLELLGLGLSAPAARLLLTRLAALGEVTIHGIARAGAQELDCVQPPAAAALRSLTVLSGCLDPAPLMALELGGLRRLRLPGGCAVDVGPGERWTEAQAASHAAALLGMAQLLDRCWVLEPEPSAGSGPPPAGHAPPRAPAYRMELFSSSPSGPGAAALARSIAALSPLGQRLSHLTLEQLPLERGAVNALRLSLPKLRELKLLGCSAAPEVLNSLLMLSVRNCNVIVRRH